MPYSGTSDGGLTENSVGMTEIDDAIKNAANGIPTLNGDGHLVGPIIFRKDTAANLDAVVLSAGEVAQAVHAPDHRAAFQHLVEGFLVCLQVTKGTCTY